ncbi:MAG: DUF3311 domain-containing protein [Gammaproteobacteria bacterium]|nr:DUF3311 domain-containing protein [Gammaproteobacteria bacterium]
MNRVKLVRAATTIYFVLFLVFVTWPGFVPFNRPLPLVLGLPFNMAAIGLWVGLGAVVLFVLDRSEERHRRGGPARDARSRPGQDSRAGGAG